jgi:1-acyl-sn-glycerol-3-phosphate acyltransferase
VRKYFVFSFLFAIRLLARPFYSIRMRWVGEPVPRPWSQLRIVCLLNHTSLFEWLYILGVPSSFLWRVAEHGVVPAAEKTVKRPIIGFFFRSIAAHVVSISRERDHTWRSVLSRIDPDSMVLILPEGRMMRRNGLDSHGQPMTVRGGIADILEAIPDGRMLLAYSGGLHHVQAPGDRLPRVFRRIWLNLEAVDISDYRAARRGEAQTDAGFKRAVVDDLERRRDLYCPTPEQRAGNFAAPARSA